MWVVGELGEAGQKPVRQGLVVKAVQYVVAGKFELLLENFLQSIGQQPAQVVAQEPFANKGAGALVAQEIPQRINVVRDFRAVVEAGIGSRTQDSGETRLVAQQGMSCCQQVFGHKSTGVGESGAHGCGYPFGLFRVVHAGSIVVYLAHFLPGQVVRQVFIERGSNGGRAHKIRIVPFGIEVHPVASRIELAPVALGRATVGN